MNYRFCLEPYRGVASRHTCPKCEQKRRFSRYIDTEGKIVFPHYVGRCDREENCGYHFTPKDYFEQHPEMSEPHTNNTQYVRPTPARKPTSYIDSEIVKQTLSHYHSNNLYLFLASKFGEQTAMEMIERYNIGTSKYWNGATIFWQRDIESKVRTGKIMLYNPETGRRIKQPHNHITWAHSLIRDENFNLYQCFFGENLLREHEQKPVAIVESEKTALIASHYLPSFVWIATGGKNGCFRDENISVLKGRKVVLFPDLGATEKWQEKLPFFERLGIEVKLFNYLELGASDEQKREGYDIADFLLEKDTPHSILESMTYRHPALKLLIEKLDLEVVDIEKTAPKQPRKRGFRM